VEGSAAKHQHRGEDQRQAYGRDVTATKLVSQGNSAPAQYSMKTAYNTHPIFETRRDLAKVAR